MRLGKNDVETREVMRTLENKLFDLASERISMSEFEHWLNSDVDILNAIDEDEFVLEVCTTNLNEGHSIYALNRLIEDRVSRELFLANMILRACQNILDFEDKNFAYRMVSLVQEQFDWGEDFALMNNFYQAYYDIDFAKDGYSSDTEVLRSIFILASEVVENMEGKEEEEKIAVLRKGVEIKFENQVESSSRFSDDDKKIDQKKRWFQFWKK